MKKLARVVAALAFAGFCTVASADDSAQHYIARPGDIVWQDVAIPPGAKIAVLEGDLSAAAPFTFRTKFPANFVIPPHWHPAIEHITVLAGTFNVGEGNQFDRSKTRPVPTGAFSFMAPNHNHFAWTGGEETILQAHGVGPWGFNFVNPADDPRKK